MEQQMPKTNNLICHAWSQYILLDTQIEFLKYSFEMILKKSADRKTFTITKNTKRLIVVSVQ